jgi:hypothetical protein
MTIEYKDSKRIVASGIGTELNGIGGWKEVGRTTLGSADANILVSSLDDKRYYMILYADKGQASNGTDVNIRLNGDTGSNYSYRRCGNGGNDATDVSTATSYGIWAGNAVQTPIFGVFYLANKSDQEKLWQGHAVTQHTAGAGNDPERSELVTKWDNISNAVSSITANGTSNLASGSEVVVLGWDPADTHTTNFWEELASIDTSSTHSTFNTGTFTAKKYLWVQVYMKGGTDANCSYYFNADSSSSGYAIRRSNNGAADDTFTATNPTGSTGLYDGYAATGSGKFANMFIINNASNEKLGILHNSIGDVSGAGAAPSRNEVVFKWDDTSAQITKITVINQEPTADFSRSIIKVWGSD